MQAPSGDFLKQAEDLARDPVLIGDREFQAGKQLASLMALMVQPTKEAAERRRDQNQRIGSRVVMHGMRPPFQERLYMPFLEPISRVKISKPD